MIPINDRLFEWILGLGPSSRYNLTSSGLSEPDLQSMGIDTSFEKFATEKDEHDKAFAATVADMYHARPEETVITIGASEAIFLVYSALGTGRTALVPLPNYEPMFEVPRSLGVKTRYSLGGASSHRSILYGFTDPNNPTGRSLDRGAVEELIESSERSRSIVYLNETYKEFGFPSVPSTYFGHGGNVVTCSTMTKFYGLGRLRVGWILAGKREAGLLSKAKWLTSGHNSEYSLWIAVQVLKNRSRFVERARRILDENRILVREFVEKTKGISASTSVAPFCLVKYRQGTGSVEFCRRLLKKTGVLVSPGDFFGARNSFRLCFTAARDTLGPGLNRLSGYLNS